MENYMITQEEANREYFNSNQNRISLDGSAAQFLNYYIAVLGLACTLGFISKEESDKIFKIIFNEIIQKSSNKIIITNRLYVFSAWLQSMSQWEAFKQLSSIKDISTANVALENADKWLKRQIVKTKTTLGMAKNFVYLLNNKELVNVYKKLMEFLNILQNYNSTVVCYKSEHASMKYFLLFDYNFLGDEQKYKDPQKSIITRINMMVSDFVLEMGILFKINGKEFIRLSNYEYSNVLFERELKRAVLERTYQDMIDSLKKRQEEEVKEGNKKISSIKKYYNKEIEKVYRTWENAEKKYNKECEVQDFKEGILDLVTDMPNLRFVMSEFTLCSFAKKGKIQYPKTRAKKAKMLEKLSTSKIVSEILSYSDNISLNTSEIAYLKRFI